jgi:LMBR1 domain-containing protein 1
MADIALIITSVIFGIMIIVGSLYFLVYFQHPDDKWVAWWPKVVVVRSCYELYKGFIAIFILLQRFLVTA